MPLLCKRSACRPCSHRLAREPGFAQKARGQGSLGTLSSAALAIANAVQFSVCSGVLRVLGLARAGPRRASLYWVFCTGFLSIIRRSEGPPVLSELVWGRECGERPGPHRVKATSGSYAPIGERIERVPQPLTIKSQVLTGVVKRGVTSMPCPTF